MNKLLYLILIPLLLLTGCSKDEDNSPESGGESLTFSISPTSHQARSESGSFIINVKANQYWSVITNDGDCSVSPSSGNGNGKVTVKYSNLAEGGSIAVIFSHKAAGGVDWATICDIHRKRTNYP